MACYHPIPAWQGENGVVKLWPPLDKENLALPCGNCIGCKAARANQWAKRCAHEAKNWTNNIFVTLTYDNEHLPPGGYLDAAELQRFFKRLRRDRERNREAYSSDHRHRISYFACGEYGEKYERPHYHALIFNTDFADKYKTGVRKGHTIFHSDTLAKNWTHGKTEVGYATPAAANYIAQYAMKRLGKGDFDPATGEYKPAPFLRMSTRPAIGYAWLDKFKDDLQNGYLVDQGKKTAVPRTYLNRLKRIDPELEEEITFNKSKFIAPDDTPERRRAAEIIHQHKLKQRVRT